MQIKLTKYAWVVCMMFIISPLKMQAQTNNQWFSWSDGKTLPVKEGLSNAIAGISNGVLIVAGGSNFNLPIQQGGKKQVHDLIYVATDDNTMNWITAGRLPAPLVNAAVVNFNGGLLVLGGTDGTNTSDQVFLLRWNTALSKIEIDSTFARLPLPLSSLSAAKLGNSIYIAGGQDAQNKPQGGFWRLKLEPGEHAGVQQWEALQTWPAAARFGAAMVAQGNGEQECLYLLGGKGTGGYLKDAFSYDPKKSRWKAIAALPRPALFSPYIALGKPTWSYLADQTGMMPTRPST